MGNAASGALDTNAFKNAMSSVIVSNSSMSLPSPESITYGGMFNEHCFDVTSPIYSGEGGPVVCPLAEHALDWCGQRWLGVFLATSGDGSARACRSGRKIELAVCIDISGSMGDPFTPPTVNYCVFYFLSNSLDGGRTYARYFQDGCCKASSVVFD